MTIDSPCSLDSLSKAFLCSAAAHPVPSSGRWFRCFRLHPRTDAPRPPPPVELAQDARGFGGCGREQDNEEEEGAENGGCRSPKGHSVPSARVPEATNGVRARGAPRWRRKEGG